MLAGRPTVGARRAAGNNKAVADCAPMDATAPEMKVIAKNETIRVFDQFRG